MIPEDILAAAKAAIGHDARLILSEWQAMHMEEQVSLALLAERKRSSARIEELEKACGAAAIAGALDLVHAGVDYSYCEANSAAIQTAKAVGINVADMNDVIRFHGEYVARFGPKGGAA